MDHETLLVHRSHWGEEPEPARHDLSRLTTECERRSMMSSDSIGFSPEYGWNRSAWGLAG
ncbi:hypothetical protein VAPA_1c17270 [Variovorax paradoxus B4]|uniref:Uncharacterized protein n=1 Tax=Variovorax paradoxus B4 TaxID=1246301 RepID=T1X9I4_VARPD|nr:hypothetical protein VAPA_1c17270 [Variovorax paradoxus B4]